VLNSDRMAEKLERRYLILGSFDFDLDGCIGFSQKSASRICLSSLSSFPNSAIGTTGKLLHPERAKRR
jgi:hypothetical protein